MIEKRPVSILHGLQFFEKIGKHLNVVFVYLSKALHVGTDVRVVGRRVKAIPNAALRVGGRAQIAGVHESRDPGDVCLKSDRLQIEHQFDVLIE